MKRDGWVCMNALVGVDGAGADFGKLPLGTIDGVWTFAEAIASGGRLPATSGMNGLELTPVGGCIAKAGTGLTACFEPVLPERA